MIIFNLEFLNTLLAFIGIIGWSWVWWFSEYKTGNSMRIQMGMILLGSVWVLLFLADTVQDLVPTSLTVISRALVLIGLWCCMPLLRKTVDPIGKSSPTVTIKKTRIRGKSL